jgi:hypothetical protein
VNPAAPSADTWALRNAITDVAERSDLAADDVVLRFGLHWGATFYVGQILTAAAQRSPHLATKSMKLLASKPARPADAHSLLKRSLNV